MNVDPRLTAVAASQPYPLLFVTISGAHLYGFPSPDSDYDLRGVHVLPPSELLGLFDARETIQTTHKPEVAGDLDLDLVTHDARKFMRLMLKRNGYVLEQLFSPLIVHTTPAHDELRSVGQRCITRFHAYHYLGFAETQWKLFRKDDPPRVKPLLYVYRVLLTGIYLMETGVVEANLVHLNQHFNLGWVDELIERKIAGPEQSRLDAADLDFHEHQYTRLVGQLTAARDRSRLPESTSAINELNDLLLRLR